MNKKFSDKMAASGYKVFMIITGGGMTAATESTRHGGASAWFLGASLPYSLELSADYCWDEDSRVTSKVAQDMVDSASAIHNGIDRTKGLRIIASCTAVLTCENERENREHLAYICISVDQKHGGYKEFNYRVDLKPGSRQAQEDALATTYTDLLLHHTQSSQRMVHPELALLY
jgi:hypothetical protein